MLKNVDESLADSKSGDELVCERLDGVVVVRMNRPEALNAANHQLHSRLARVWDELATDDSIRSIVLTGAGRAFSAGGDLGVLERMSADEVFRRQTLSDTVRMVRGMISFPMPIIAAVNGPAVGLGCSLAAMSDIVLIERSAYLADPHVAIGLVAGDGGAITWPGLTSLIRAKEYLFTGDRISAPVAVELGLANRVVDDGSSLTEALELAGRLAKQPPLALRATKRLVNRALERNVSETLDFAIAAEDASSASRDHFQIVEAMLAKARTIADSKS